MSYPFDPIYAAATYFLPAKMIVPEAKAMLIAIALQESQFRFRQQHYQGPARGFWQFEMGGGVRGVLEHKQTGPILAPILEAFCYSNYPADVWNAIENNDVLACIMARLLLWTVPQKLPGPTDVDEAWRQYQWAWRPGKPHPERWPENYATAWQAI